jgi:hypothetical protein
LQSSRDCFRGHIARNVDLDRGLDYHPGNYQGICYLPGSSYGGIAVVWSKGVNQNADTRAIPTGADEFRECEAR